MISRPSAAGIAAALALVGGLAMSFGASAQLRPQPVAEQAGNAALALLLRKLSSTGTFMEATAHPDDEHNALLAMLGHGDGMRTVLVSATRGEGGQNEIGPELFEALGVLRTEELLAVHRFDGAEQYFTRAVDFGQPNRIDAAAWDGWVQKRGLYFLGARDPRYVDLVRSADPFPFNPGPKTGALVEARVGQGRWIYIGLGLWRQLPAGTDGAYRLLANLLSLGRAR